MYRRGVVGGHGCASSVGLSLPLSPRKAEELARGRKLPGSQARHRTSLRAMRRDAHQEPAAGEPPAKALRSSDFKPRRSALRFATHDCIQTPFVLPCFPPLDAFPVFARHSATPRSSSPSSLDRQEGRPLPSSTAAVSSIQAKPRNGRQGIETSDRERRTNRVLEWTKSDRRLNRMRVVR